MICRRSKPRRGRVHDPDFLAWLHEEQRCAVHGVGGCSTPYSVHHVRSFGGQKNDRRVLGLCAELHLHDWGLSCIERLSKEDFEALHGISIEAEITRYNADYAEQFTLEPLCS